jgi:hypothetical protein
VRWNPFSRFLCLCGFGNLPGDVEFFDKKADGKCKPMGACKMPCTVSLQWSPCGRHVLLATTAPRLRVDNGFKVLSYNGDVEFQQSVEVRIHSIRTARHGRAGLQNGRTDSVIAPISFLFCSGLIFTTVATTLPQLGRFLGSPALSLLTSSVRPRRRQRRTGFTHLRLNHALVEPQRTLMAPQLSLRCTDGARWRHGLRQHGRVRCGSCGEKGTLRGSMATGGRGGVRGPPTDAGARTRPRRRA